MQKSRRLKNILCSVLVIISLVFTNASYAQVQTAKYVSMITNSKAYYEYLPQGYESGTEKYPLLIFVHGLGELGAGTSATLPAILRNGPPKLINNGTFPVSFTVNGQTFKFIVISPQFVNWPSPQDMSGVIDYAVSHYRVDPTRIYLTGLSMGGGLVWLYSSTSAAYANRVAAILPVAGADGLWTGNIIGASNLPVWATHNTGDPTIPVSRTQNNVNLINTCSTPPTPRAKMTIFTASGHDAWSKTYDPNFKENNLNVYEWLLSYKRGSATNLNPAANAGADKTITLPTATVTLTGTGTDSDGSISAYAWTKVSGPTSSTIVSPAAATTVINALTAGTYVFRLTVKDNAGATSYDDVSVIVKAANVAPTANAGADKAITLPMATVTLAGTGTDTDGTISTYAWTKVSGPTSSTIVSATAASTVINALTAGTYVFRLTVTDNGGLTKTDDVTVTVTAAVNVAPTANAGADKTITLPTATVTLTGTGTDTDGTISAYAWTKVSGPTSSTIVSTTAATTVINALTAGTYVFRLTVTDNGGLTKTDDVTVIVNAAANVAPTANAGADKTITLPTETVTLTGTGTDTDGTISAYAWTKVSGPTSSTIVSATAATTVINALTAGTYVFRLTVTDNSGSTKTDDVTVSVNAAGNVAPTANAGADKTITLPTATVTLTGTGTDTDGTISAYAWTKVSGPTSSTIVSTTAATTVINALTAGTYVFRLTVTDNGGLTKTDDVTVTVNAAANVAPTANAGADQSITLPTALVTLTGSGTDSDGTISSYAWTKVSGPTAGTIVSATAASTVINSLAEGTYTFRLTVTDNAGLTKTDDVIVTVTAAAATPTTGKVINVNLYEGSAFSNTEWNNWNVTTSNLASGAFKYSDGTASTVKGSFSAHARYADNGAGYAATASACPSEVLRFNSILTINRTLTITGLKASGKYSFDFYASRAYTGQKTIYSIGAKKDTINTDYNADDYAQLSDITADSKGTVVVTLAGTSVYNYIAGFTIYEDNAAARTTTASKNAYTNVQTAEAARSSATPVEDVEKLMVATTVNVYPNPVKGALQVQLETANTGTTQVTMQDVQGRVIYTRLIKSEQKINLWTIDMAPYKDGMYILTVRSGSEQPISKKIIKQAN